MAAPRDLHKSNLILSGPENQDIRLLIRVSKLRFTAINDSGLPLLEALLPLAEWCLTIRNALLALAGLLRVKMRQERCLFGAEDEEHSLQASAAALERYQVALSTLRERVFTLQFSNACESDALEVLGSALLLTIAGFPRTMQPEDSHEWSQHMRGMVSLVESLDSSLPAHSGIRRLVKHSVAHLDIGAFALGRTQRSDHAWLRWDIHPPEAPPSPDFDPLEVVVGYPKSLLTIIATISAALEMPDGDTTLSVRDLVDRLYQQTRAGRQASTTNLPEEHASSVNNVTSATMSKLEAVLMMWEPPDVPERFSVDMVIALTGAWEVMRKAALLYFWRGGFGADTLTPLPTHTQSMARRYVREILFGLRTLLDLCETQSITLMNIMTWPLIVVGNECGGSTQLQHEVEAMLRKTQQRFQIEHLKHLSSMLQELWRRFGQYSHGAEDLADSLSLDGLCRELGVCLPLF
ncbi:hypothetical protein FDECE_13038 [Fusarium decemcellulare]|nr:hypothetical protein FDECE_13038 [Fusarium decemcellulare]